MNDWPLSPDNRATGLSLDRDKVAAYPPPKRREADEKPPTQPDPGVTPPVFVTNVRLGLSKTLLSLFRNFMHTGLIESMCMTLTRFAVDRATKKDRYETNYPADSNGSNGGRHGASSTTVRSQTQWPVNRSSSPGAATGALRDAGPPSCHRTPRGKPKWPLNTPLLLRRKDLDLTFFVEKRECYNRGLESHHHR